MHALQLLLVILAIWVNPTVQQQCHTSEMYSCFIPSMLNARGSLMPKDNASLTEYCKLKYTSRDLFEFERMKSFSTVQAYQDNIRDNFSYSVWRKGWKCHDNYLSKCVADIHITMAEVVLGQSRQVFKDVCESNSKIREDLVKHLPCASEAVTLTLKKCMNNLENVIHMVYSDNAEDRVNGFCCYFERGYQCFKRNVKELCGKGAFGDILPALRFFHIDTIDKVCSHHDPDGEMCFDYLKREVPPPSEAASYLARFATRYLRSLQ